MKRHLPLALILLLARPVHAQRSTEPETSSHIQVPTRARIPDEPGASPAERSRVIMREFARCVVDRRYDLVARAASLSPGAEFDKAVAALSTRDCLEAGEIRFRPIVIRGPLFKELFVRRTIALGKGRAWGPTVAKISFAAPMRDFNDTQKQHVALMAFADCVVSADPGDAKTVVLAPSLSTAQEAAIKALMPHLGPCVSQGATIKLGKQTIEGALAEVLYRGTEPVRPTTAVEAK